MELSKHRLVCEKRCSQCLFSDAKIVDDQRKVDIIKDCLKNNNVFECHKGTIANQHIMRRGWWDKYIPQDNITKLLIEIGHYKFVKIPNNEL